MRGQFAMAGRIFRAKPVKKILPAFANTCEERVSDVERRRERENDRSRSIDERSEEMRRVES